MVTAAAAKMRIIGRVPRDGRTTGGGIVAKPAIGDNAAVAAAVFLPAPVRHITKTAFPQLRSTQTTHPDGSNLRQIRHQLSLSRKLEAGRKRGPRGKPGRLGLFPGRILLVDHDSPPGAAPEKLAATALKAMRQQYDDLDADEVSETVAGQELVGYDMNFYCLDLTNTAQVRSYDTPDGVYVIFCQADDREFAEIEEIFRAITTSLLR